MGRKAFEFTAERIQMVERMAAVGMAEYLMAGVLGISPRTFAKYKAKMPEINAAIQRGMGEAAFIVGKSLFNEARDGNVQAVRWFEATRLGYSEKVTNENTVTVKTPDEERAELDQLEALLAEHGIDPD